MKKWLGLAFLLGIVLEPACGGEEFSFEPGYCFTAGNGGKAGCATAGSSGAAGDCCSAGNGGQAGAGQAGSGGKASGTSGKAGSGGSSKGGSAGVSGGGQTGSGGQSGAGAGGSGGNIAGSGGAAGQSTGGAGSGGTSGSSGAAGGGQAGSSGQATGGAGQAGMSGSAGSAGTGGQPTVCGDGVKNGAEACDGSNFGSATCASIKGIGWGGNLICSNCNIDSSSCVAPPNECSPGTFGTPTGLIATAEGSTSNSLYVHFQSGTEVHSNIMQNFNFDGLKLPGEVVFSGQDHGKLVFIGGTVTYFKVNVSTVNACTGSAYFGKPCEEKVAKDFRCTFYPANESGCSIQAIFTNIGEGMSHEINSSGNNKILASIRCKQPLPPPLNLNTPNLTRSRDRVLQTDSTGQVFVPAKVGQQTESSALRSKVPSDQSIAGLFLMS